MSYILDALKRADAERGQPPTNGLPPPPSDHVPTQAAPRGGRSVGRWPMAALALTAVAFAVWALRPGPHDRSNHPAPGPQSLALAPKPLAPQPAAPALPIAPPTPAVKAANPAPPIATAPIQAPKAPAATITAPPVAARQAVAQPASVPPILAEAPPQQPTRPPAAPPVAPPGQAFDPSPEAIQRRANMFGAPKVPPAASAPSAPPTTAVAAPPQAPVPTAAPSAPASAAGVPAIAISGSSYSTDPEHRLLIANGKVVKEGQSLAPGLTLEVIGPRGAIFNHQGTRFNVNY